MIINLRTSFLVCLVAISVNLVHSQQSLAYFGCVSSPCRNGGICNQLQNGGYVCTCINAGFTGKNCEILTNNYYGLQQNIPGL